MELVGTLRLLWRRRLLVALGAVAAAAVFLVGAGGKTREISIASTGVVLDTPDSQLIHPAPRGAETLPWRAGLLADLLTTRPAVTRLAREAGVSRRQLAVMDPSLALPPVPASLPKNAAEVAARTPGPYVLLVTFDQLIPIVSIDAAAPSRRAAVRLAAAAAAALKAGAPSTSATSRPAFVVESVGPIRTKRAGGKSNDKVALAVSCLSFVLWCAAIAVVSGFRAALRRAGGSGELVPS